MNYKEKFVNENGYPYCEICGRSDCFNYHIHHIVYRSEVPKHKELNNNKNLILLCENCHYKLHADKKLRINLVKKRGLSNLFNI